SSGSRSTQDVLARAFDGALGLLAQRVTQSDFSSTVRTAFGDAADRKAVASVLQDILVEHGTPKLKLVSADTLLGAHAAYDAKSDTIFVSKDYVAAHATDTAALERVVLEELGHAIDARLGAMLGTPDAPGDEGAIFSALV